MNERPQIHKIPRRLQVGGVTIDAIVLHPEGGKFALDVVTVSRPGGSQYRYTPRERSHETMDEIDEELRQSIEG